MSNLKETIDEMLEIFNEYNILEEAQKKIITNGISFDFTYGGYDNNNINRKYDCFKFSRFLKFCKSASIDIDVDLMLSSPWDPCFKELIHFYDTIDVDPEKNKNPKTK